MSLAIDLFDLRLFVHVAETRSLTRGADRACISLGAASTRVKNMEEALGSKLLNRTTQGMVMTPAGETLLAHARKVHRQMEQLRCDLHEYGQGVRGRVHIHANTSSISEFLPEALADFLGRHAGVGIELKESLSDEAVRAVSEGQADIGVVAGEVDTAGLSCRPFATNQLVLVANSRSVFARRAKVAFADILHEPQVGLHDGSALHRFLARRAEQVGKRFHPRAQVGSFEAICRMVEAGVGVGVVPVTAALRHACAMDILCVPLAETWARRELQVIARDEAGLPALTLEVFQHLAGFGARTAAAAAAAPVPVPPRRHAGLALAC